MLVTKFTCLVISWGRCQHHVGARYLCNISYVNRKGDEKGLVKSNTRSLRVFRTFLRQSQTVNSNAKCTVICLNAIVLARSISDD